LIEALLDKNYEHHLEIEMKISSQKTNVIKKIVQMIQFHLNDFSKFGDKWFSDLQIHKPELWNKHTRFKSDKYHIHFKKIFIQGKKEKFIKDMPLDLILNGIETIVKGALQTDFLLNSKLSFKQALDYSIDILLSGILTTKGLKIYNKEKKLLKLYKF
jgi:hypothetical protein